MVPTSNSARRTKATRSPSPRPRGGSPALTELDHFVLGIVWRDGPMTTYAVRNRFRTSATAAWSASTGSIYPAIRRLLASGMLKASADRDARGTQDVQTTALGVRTLKAWLRGVPPGLAGPDADPVRTRVQFLGALGPRESASFLSKVEADCLAALKTLTALESKERGVREAQRIWALRGASHELGARLKWIRWLRRVGSADLL